MFQFRLDLQLLHFLFEQSEEIEEIEMTGREKKKRQETVHKQKHTRIYSTHTQTEARTHKLTKQQKKARGCLDILKVGNTGGVRVRRSGVRQRHHTAHSQHNPDLYSCSFVDFAKFI